MASASGTATQQIATLKSALRANIDQRIASSFVMQRPGFYIVAICDRHARAQSMPLPVEIKTRKHRSGACGEPRRAFRSYARNKGAGGLASGPWTAPRSLSPVRLLLVRAPSQDGQ